MTVNEVIEALQRIVNDYPEKGDVKCCIYSVETEYPEEVSSVDGSISDRVDLNGALDG